MYIMFGLFRLTDWRFRCRFMVLVMMVLLILLVLRFVVVLLMVGLL